MDVTTMGTMVAIERERRRRVIAAREEQTATLLLEQARLLYADLNDSNFRAMLAASDTIEETWPEEKLHNEGELNAVRTYLLERFARIALELTKILLALPDGTLPDLDSYDADNPDVLYQLDYKLAMERSEIEAESVARAVERHLNLA